MGRERELAIKELIDLRVSAIEQLASTGALESVTLVATLAELEGLEQELKALRGDDPDSPEPDALVGVRLKPRPHLNSGAIALTEPDGLP